MPKVPPIKPYGTENLIELRFQWKFKGYIEGEENRGITLPQLKEVVDWSRTACYWWCEQLPKQRRLKAPDKDDLTFNWIAKWAIGPATVEKACAFLEFITDEKQTPIWFVSHAWNGKIHSFVDCIENHHKTRALSTYYDVAPYWVSAFAVREVKGYMQEDQFKDGPEKMGFYKAIHLTKGILVVLGSSKDESSNAFRRMWCAFEVSIAADLAQSTTGALMMDIAIEHKGEAQLLTSGLTAKERETEEQKPGSGNWAKEVREKGFPLEVLRHGMFFKFEELAMDETEYIQETEIPPPPGDLTARATIKLEDKVTEYRTEMLKYVSGVAEKKPSPPMQHKNFDLVSQKVHSELAMIAWRPAVLLTDRKHGGPDFVEEFQLPAVLREASSRDTLLLDLFGMDEVDDESVASVGRGIPRNLNKLELRFSKCRNINDRGIRALAPELPQDVSEMLLDFSDCGVISDSGMKALAENLPQKRLEKLALRFKNSQGTLTDIGVSRLSNRFPYCLLDLELDFSSCIGVGQQGVEAIANHLLQFGSLDGPPLRSLHLDFWMCGAINNDGGIHGALGGIQMLSESFPKNLETLHLSFTGLHGDFSDKGVKCIADNLPKALKTLKLDFFYLDRLGDPGIEKLGHSLPLTLETLELKIEGCDRISDAGLSILSEQLPADLVNLVLNCEFCNRLTEKGVIDMAERIPVSLRSLSLNFGSCRDVKDVGIITLASFLPASLEKLSLNLNYCKKVGDKSVMALGKSLPPGLTELRLLFGDCEFIYDAGMVELAKGLPATIEWLELNLFRCRNVGDTSVFYLAKYLPPACKTLLLSVDGTKVSQEVKGFCNGIEAMRCCKPTENDLLAPLEQPRPNPPVSQIAWTRRHGPNIKGLDDLLAKGAPEMEMSSPGSLSKMSLMSKTNSGGFKSPTGSRMSKSQSTPTFHRKKPPIALQRPLSKTNI